MLKPANENETGLPRCTWPVHHSDREPVSYYIQRYGAVTLTKLIVVVGVVRTLVLFQWSSRSAGEGRMQSR